MAKIDEATLGLYFSKLMTSKLRAHLDWEKPVLDNFAGPYDPAAFSPYDNKRQQIVDECRAKLATYSDSSISVLINRSKDDPNDVVKEWRNFKVNEIYDLDKRKPPWYAGGFGHPKYVADFDYWAQSRFFTNHEALLLSLGVEPKHFDEKSIVTLSEKMRRGVNLWEPLVYMVRRREQIERHFFRAVHQNKIDPKALFECRIFAVIFGVLAI